jgi:Tfp pilus assembly protein PilV
MLTREDGFTLIEVLVATLCSVVIIAGLFTLVDTTLHSSTRTLTKADATQRARYTIEKIMNELNSACLSYGATPIQSGSTGTSLIFTNQYGNAADPSGVTHTIAYNSGTLTDTSGGVTTTLLTNVSQSGSTPMFQYFAYEEPENSSGALYTDAAGNPYMMLLDGTSYVPGTSTNAANDPDPLTTPLSSTSAPSAVEVKMTLAVGPNKQEGEETGLSNVTDTVTDSVVLRLTPAANDDTAGSTFSPCE